MFRQASLYDDAYAVVAPSVANTAKRFARTNPLLAIVIAMVTASVLWSFVGTSHSSRSHRSRRHARAAVTAVIARG